MSITIERIKEQQAAHAGRLNALYRQREVQKEALSKTEEEILMQKGALVALEQAMEQPTPPEAEKKE